MTTPSSNSSGAPRNLRDITGYPPISGTRATQETSSTTSTNAPVKLQGTPAQQLSSSAFRNAGTVFPNRQAPAFPAQHQHPVTSFLCSSSSNNSVYLPATAAAHALNAPDALPTLDFEESYSSSLSSSNTQSTETEQSNTDTTATSSSTHQSSASDSSVNENPPTVGTSYPRAMARTRLIVLSIGSARNPIPLNNNNLPEHLKIVGVHKRDGKVYLKYQSNEGKFYISKEASMITFTPTRAATQTATSAQTTAKPAFSRTSSAPHQLPNTLSKKTKSKPSRSLFNAFKNSIFVESFTAVCGVLFLPLIFAGSEVYRLANKHLLSTKNKSKGAAPRAPLSNLQSSSATSTSSGAKGTSSNLSRTSSTLPPPPPARLGTKENPVILDNGKALPPAGMFQIISFPRNTNGYIILKGIGPFSGNFYAVTNSAFDDAPPPIERHKRGSLENPILGELPLIGYRADEHEREIDGQIYYICKSTGPYEENYYAVPLDEVETAATAFPVYPESSTDDIDRDMFEYIFTDHNSTTTSSSSFTTAPNKTETNGPQFKGTLPSIRQGNETNEHSVVPSADEESSTLSSDSTQVNETQTQTIKTIDLETTETIIPLTIEVETISAEDTNLAQTSAPGSQSNQNKELGGVHQKESPSANEMQTETEKTIDLGTTETIIPLTVEVEKLDKTSTSSAENTSSSEETRTPSKSNDEDISGGTSTTLPSEDVR